MKRNVILVGLSAIMLVCRLLTGPAQAQFTQQAKLVGTGAEGIGGNSVSLSGDGNTAIVGAPGDNNLVGAAWVFTRSAGVWSELAAKLVGAGAEGFFPTEQGYSVSLSGDGNTAIVGGPGDVGFSGVGAAWVYTRSGAVWIQQANLVGTGAVASAYSGGQGWSVSLSGDGDTALVGGPNDNFFVGAAWVYTRSGGVWSQQAKLVAIDAVGPFPGQGASVSLSADGNTAIVGGVGDTGGAGDNNAVGAAWVYTRSAGVWSQQVKLVATDAVGNAEQGYSVSLSGDGNTAIVCGPGVNGGVGAAWVYTRSGGVRSQQAKLVGDFRGNSASLSVDGNTAIVGSPDYNDGAGTAWVYRRVAGVWSQLAEKLIGTGAVGPFANQGASVSLSADGSTAIVGGPGDEQVLPGAAWVFAQPIGALSSGESCNGTFDGTFDGDVTVSAGQNCVFTNDGEIKGNVTLNGGNFTLSSAAATGNVADNGGNLALSQRSSVGGNVQLTRASAFTIGPGAAIGGNLQIQNLSGGLPQGTVCGTQVKGNLQAQNDPSPLEIGGLTSSGCAGNTVVGNLQVQNNTAAVSIDYNTVGGNLQVDNDGATTDVSGNAVGGNLQCQNNHVVTYVALNIVKGQNQGQCAAFSP